MDIRSELLKEHSKQQATKIANYIGDNQALFDQLVMLFLGKEYRTTQRAAWPLGFCASTHPALLQPHLHKIISNLRNDVHDAVKRNTVKLLQNINLPDDLLGETADICFGFLESRQEPIAVKVFSMSVLLNIVKKEPDLKKELQILIEDQMPYGSPGFRSRGGKVLSALHKIRNTKNE